jgi:nucleotide-binding universal stress UspA family protein
MELKLILVPTDLSPIGALGLHAGSGLAARVGARLALLHVLSERRLEFLCSAAAAHSSLDAISHDMEATLLTHFRDAVPEDERRSLVVDPVVTFGTPFEEIIRAAHLKGADLIVLGARGRTGLARAVLRSVPERVARAARCPTLIVHPVRSTAEPSTRLPAAVSPFTWVDGVSRS